MNSPLGYRTNKQSHRRSGNFGPRPINTKINHFAHTHFSPTDPTRSPRDRDIAWIQAEKLDSPALMATSLNKAADNWECQNCSLEIRMLASSINSKLRGEINAAPTSHPSPNIGSTNLSSPVASQNIEITRRQTLSRDIGNRPPFYGVHQALFDLSLGESVTVHMRRSDRVFGNLSPGMIISAPFHSQYRNDTISTMDHNTGVSAFGPVYSKYRKMVVIENWQEHVVCLPIYTYNGVGLKNRQAMIDEYMDIRDAEDESPAACDIHDERPLLAVRDVNWIGKNTFIRGKAVVKLTERVTHMLFQKCSIEGKVEPQHFQRMYSTMNKLNQAKILELFGKPLDSW
ncbi:hypothetical protein FLONG3_3959 [Fusarium longipes]|uniref:DUF6590 domain-containing protein n=1 Tax=Fusarium longipes TaxID=694270 RepID=A0A395SZP8_9HYPO|nr:hypothetical protein FLONG3_3959 [Fusarium longipes]